MLVIPRPYLLDNPIQPYAWGTQGATAFIPQLLGIPAEPNRPYAELWIGAHPSAPSTVQLDGETLPLDRWIAEAPAELLGRRVAAQFANRLPFLCKVLSAARPLSIQAHPNRTQAAQLHHRDPTHYPDTNHKPEIAIAIDSLTALVGFRPFPELRQILLDYPELSEFIGPPADPLAAGELASEEAARACLRASYTALIARATTDPAALAHTCAQLAARFTRETDPRIPIEQLFMELYPHYPNGDVGLLTLFLLNLVQLRTGEGLFTGAGVLHAYLRGNLVECMANSDNVLRAGLTRKFTDAEQLAKILIYEASPPVVLRPATQNGVTVYTTPATEFEVSRWQLAPGERRTLTNMDSPETLLAIRGTATLSWGTHEELRLGRGQAALIPAVLRTYALTGGTDGVDIFRVVTPDTHSSSA